MPSPINALVPKRGNALIRVRNALSDPEFYRRDIAREGSNALAGITSGVLGTPVDLMTMALRPLGYSVPAEHIVGSSEWIGRKLGADTQGAPFLAGTIGAPDPKDLGLAGALLATRVGRVAKRADDLSHAERSASPLDLRQARAKEGGFYDVNVYHGTGGDVPEFDLSRGGATSGSSVGRLGVSVALDPEVAAEFANQAGSAGGAAKVMPLRFRAEEVGSIALDGTETNPQIAATISEAWDSGFDAVELTNYTTPGGLTGRTILIVRDPSQIRSVNAEFDPAKRSSANLMAGGAAGAVGLGLASNDRE